MTAADWTAYRKCPACAAEIGQPCVARSGLTAAGITTTPIDQPHGSRQPRKPRTGGSR